MNSVTNNNTYAKVLITPQTASEWLNSCNHKNRKMKILKVGQIIRIGKIFPILTLITKKWTFVTIVTNLCMSLKKIMREQMISLQKMSDWEIETSTTRQKSG